MSRTIYIDADCKCHATGDGTMTALETDVFEGKCAAFLEGYRYVPPGTAWTRADGVTFTGEMVAPWKPWEELAAAQAAYERKQLAEYQEALKIVGVIV